MRDRLDEAVALGSRLLEQGALQGADLLLRMAMEEWGPRASALNLLGQIAMRVGEPALAAEAFERARGCDPYFKPASRNLAAAQRAIPAAAGPGTDAWRRARLESGVAAGYLVIRSWGAGFFADVDHVLGNLLLAEITGRVPVVVWGRNSRWSVPGRDECWSCYFEPVSGVAVDSLADRTFFPGHWNARNLAGENINRWTGPGARLGGPALLNRAEDVVVADFASPVAQMRGWLPAGHPQCGRGTLEVFRALVRRNLRLASDIAAEVEAFHRDRIGPGAVMGVHVRGADKITEVGDLDRINASYPGLVDAAVARDPELRIFLLTDSVPVVDEFTRRYGPRLIVAPCERAAGSEGVHLGRGGGADRRRLGIEVIRDVYTAAGCDRFLGLGSSNVSCMVQHLKDWPEGACVLLGRRMSLRPPLDIHLPAGLGRAAP